MTTVYTKPNCGDCEKTKTFLNEKNIEYIIVDLTKDRDALAEVKSWGCKQAPVVKAPTGEIWSGYQKEKLETLVA